MLCPNHCVNVNSKNGDLYCPDCGEIFDDASAMQCLKEIFHQQTPIELAFRQLKSVSELIKSQNP